MPITGRSGSAPSVSVPPAPSVSVPPAALSPHPRPIASSRNGEYPREGKRVGSGRLARTKTWPTTAAREASSQWNPPLLATCRFSDPEVEVARSLSRAVSFFLCVCVCVSRQVTMVVSFACSVACVSQRIGISGRVNLENVNPSRGIHLLPRTRPRLRPPGTAPPPCPPLPSHPLPLSFSTRGSSASPRPYHRSRGETGYRGPETRAGRARNRLAGEGHTVRGRAARLAAMRKPDGQGSGDGAGEDERTRGCRRRGSWSGSGGGLPAERRRHG